MSKKESALDLAKFVDKGIRVKLAGGREGRLLWDEPCGHHTQRLVLARGLHPSPPLLCLLVSGFACHTWTAAAAAAARVVAASSVTGDWWWSGRRLIDSPHHPCAILSGVGTHLVLQLFPTPSTQAAAAASVMGWAVLCFYAHANNPQGSCSVQAAQAALGVCTCSARACSSPQAAPVTCSCPLGPRCYLSELRVDVARQPITLNGLLWLPALRCALYSRMLPVLCCCSDGCAEGL